jgi:hypothetical protein
MKDTMNDKNVPEPTVYSWAAEAEAKMGMLPIAGTLCTTTAAWRAVSRIETMAKAVPGWTDAGVVIGFRKMALEKGETVDLWMARILNNDKKLEVFNVGVTVDRAIERLESDVVQLLKATREEVATEIREALDAAAREREAGVKP